MEKNASNNNTCKSIFKGGDYISKEAFTSRMIDLINSTEKNKATITSLPRERKS